MLLYYECTLVQFFSKPRKIHYGQTAETIILQFLVSIYQGLNYHFPKDELFPPTSGGVGTTSAQVLFSLHMTLYNTYFETFPELILTCGFFILQLEKSTIDLKKRISTKFVFYMQLSSFLGMMYMSSAALQILLNDNWNPFKNIFYMARILQSLINVHFLWSKSYKNRLRHDKRQYVEGLRGVCIL